MKLDNSIRKVSVLKLLCVQERKINKNKRNKEK